MYEAAFSADLIVIIAIAAFVVYKYRQVLGHKTGLDVENPSKRANRSKDPKVVSLKQFQQEIEEDGIIIEHEKPDTSFNNLEEGELKNTLSEMKKEEPSFSLEAFLQGAKGAFDMVMEAFEKDDRTTLKQLLSDELYREFDQELKNISKQNEKPHTTLVSILSANLVQAKLTKQQAQMTVRFLTEQIHVSKNAKGEVVGGDPSRIEQVEDEWVFERQLRSRNPNWTITDM